MRGDDTAKISRPSRARRWALRCALGIGLVAVFITLAGPRVAGTFVAWSVARSLNASGLHRAEVSGVRLRWLGPQEIRSVRIVDSLGAVWSDIHASTDAPVLSLLGPRGRAAPGIVRVGGAVRVREDERGWLIGGLARIERNDERSRGGGEGSLAWRIPEGLHLQLQSSGLELAYEGRSADGSVHTLTSVVEGSVRLATGATPHSVPRGEALGTKSGGTPPFLLDLRGRIQCADIEGDGSGGQFTLLAEAKRLDQRDGVVDLDGVQWKLRARAQSLPADVISLLARLDAGFGDAIGNNADVVLEAAGDRRQASGRLSASALSFDRAGRFSPPLNRSAAERFSSWAAGMRLVSSPTIDVAFVDVHLPFAHPQDLGAPCRDGGTETFARDGVPRYSSVRLEFAELIFEGQASGPFRQLSLGPLRGELAHDATSDSDHLTLTANAAIDGIHAGVLHVDLTADSLSAGAVPALAGVIELDNVQTSLVAPLLQPLGIHASDLGPTLQLAIAFASETERGTGGGGTETLSTTVRAQVEGSSENVRLGGQVLIADGIVQSDGPIRLEAKSIAPFLARHTGAADLQLDTDGGLVAELSGLSLDLGIPRAWREPSARPVLRAGDLTIELAALEGTLAHAGTMTTFNLWPSDARIVLGEPWPAATAQTALSLDGLPAGRLTMTIGPGTDPSEAEVAFRLSGFDSRLAERLTGTSTGTIQDFGPSVDGSLVFSGLSSLGFGSTLPSGSVDGEVTMARLGARGRFTSDGRSLRLHGPAAELRTGFAGGPARVHPLTEHLAVRNSDGWMRIFLEEFELPLDGDSWLGRLESARIAAKLAAEGFDLIAHLPGSPDLKTSFTSMEVNVSLSPADGLGAQLGAIAITDASKATPIEGWLQLPARQAGPSPWLVSPEHWRPRGELTMHAIPVPLIEHIAAALTAMRPESEAVHALQQTLLASIGESIDLTLAVTDVADGGVDDDTAQAALNLTSPDGSAALLARIDSSSLYIDDARARLRIPAAEAAPLLGFLGRDREGDRVRLISDAMVAVELRPLTLPRRDAWTRSEASATTAPSATAHLKFALLEPLEINAVPALLERGQTAGMLTLGLSHLSASLDLPLTAGTPTFAGAATLLDDLARPVGTVDWRFNAAGAIEASEGQLTVKGLDTQWLDRILGRQLLTRGALGSPVNLHTVLEPHRGGLGGVMIEIQSPRLRMEQPAHLRISPGSIDLANAAKFHWTPDRSWASEHLLRANPAAGSRALLRFTNDPEIVLHITDALLWCRLPSCTDTATLAASFTAERTDLRTPDGTLLAIHSAAGTVATVAPGELQVRLEAQHGETRARQAPDGTLHIRGNFPSPWGHDRAAHAQPPIIVEGRAARIRAAALRSILKQEQWFEEMLGSAADVEFDLRAEASGPAALSLRSRSAHNDLRLAGIIRDQTFHLTDRLEITQRDITVVLGSLVLDKLGLFEWAESVPGAAPARLSSGRLQVPLGRALHNVDGELTLQGTQFRVRPTPALRQLIAQAPAGQGGVYIASFTTVEARIERGRMFIPRFSFTLAGFQVHAQGEYNLMTRRINGAVYLPVGLLSDVAVARWQGIAAGAAFRQLRPDMHLKFDITGRIGNVQIDPDLGSLLDDEAEDPRHRRPTRPPPPVRPPPRRPIR